MLPLIVLLAAPFMEVLDSTIVDVAIPAIHARLGATSGQIEWVGGAYALSYRVLLIPGGRLGDAWGRRRLFLLGLADFTFASAMCGAAAGPAMPIAGRTAQGVCGALGPVLGDLLISANPLDLSWRAIFLVNLPLGVLAALAGLRLLPESRGEAGSVDLAGAALLAVALLLLLVPLTSGRDAGWPLWTSLSPTTAVPALALFAAHQRRRRGGAGGPRSSTPDCSGSAPSPPARPSA